MSIYVPTGDSGAVSIQVGTTGPPGPPGPPGEDGGTPVIALPYVEWPPVNPVPGTLYLRMAP